MILITSAAYITDEFASEIGLIPPSFLPIGNKRLFEHQIELLKQLKGKIYLSLPKGYRVESGDRHILQYLNVELIFVPENLSLGESILYCWNATGYPHDTLSILHGDTLFTDINLESQDHISVHKNKGFYQRASISIDSLHSEHFSNKWAGEDETVVSGYFSFTKPAKLMKGIVENNGDFVKALEQYATEVKLKEISSGHWFDLGHLNSFFRSRSEITTQRAFNEMKITTRVVQKASSNDNKMLAESNWFDSLPNSLRIHIPQLIEPFANNSESKGSYKLEYLYLLPLSDLFVYGALSLGAWNRICDSVALVMREFSQFETKDFDLKETDKLYLPKTLDRLRNFQKQSSFDINKKLTWKKTH
ncbi:hypothetical protein [Paraglaciecola sp.]|uniref:hypothetical protein n=1 Tax=Paraglaciecola sp. TaxID=1920173 RepID=UPI003264A4DE